MRCFIVLAALVLAACDPVLIAVDESAPLLANAQPPTVLRLLQSGDEQPDMAGAPDTATASPPDMASPPPADSDGDGVADAVDKCRMTPAGNKPDPKRPGCPSDVVTLIPVEGVAGSVDAVAGYMAGGVDNYYASTVVGGRAYVSDAPAGDLLLGRLVVAADVTLPTSDPRCTGAAGEVKTYIPPSAATGGYTLCVPSQLRDLRLSDAGTDVYSIANLPIATGQLLRTLPGTAQYFSIAATARSLSVSAAVVGTVKLGNVSLAVEVTSRWSR